MTLLLLLRSEGTGTGTPVDTTIFSMDPTYVYDESISYKVDITVFEDGGEQRRLRGSPRHVFSLEFLSISEDDRDTIHNFFITHKGRYGTFSWVNPLDSITYNVRFATDNLEETNIGYNETIGDIFDIRFQFEEVI